MGGVRVCDTAFRNTRCPPTDSPTTRVTAANPRSGAENRRSQITSTNWPTGRRVGGSAGRQVGRYGPWPQLVFLCKPRKPLGCGVLSVIVTRHRRLTRANAVDSRYEVGTPAHGNAFFGRASCRFESDLGAPCLAWSEAIRGR